MRLDGVTEVQSAGAAQSLVEKRLNRKRLVVGLTNGHNGHRCQSLAKKRRKLALSPVFDSQQWSDTLSAMSDDPYGKGFQCFVCNGSIPPKDRHGWTVLIEPRLITEEQEVESPQFIWAHDKCLVRLIPLAAYPYPELEQQISQDDN